MASITCAQGHTHRSVAEVRDCHAEAAYWAEVESNPDPDEDGFDAYVRHLENAGFAEAELERQIETERGIISFSDAWDLADPSRVTARQEARAAG